ATLFAQAKPLDEALRVEIAVPRGDPDPAQSSRRGTRRHTGQRERRGRGAFRETVGVVDAPESGTGQRRDALREPAVEAHLVFANRRHASAKCQASIHECSLDPLRALGGPEAPADVYEVVDRRVCPGDALEVEVPVSNRSCAGRTLYAGRRSRTSARPYRMPTCG